MFGIFSSLDKVRWYCLLACFPVTFIAITLFGENIFVVHLSLLNKLLDPPHEEIEIIRK